MKIVGAEWLIFAAITVANVWLIGGFFG